MKPPSILDPKFRYVSSGDTDLRKTFARVRQQQAREKKAAPKAPTRFVEMTLTKTEL